jgi:hypothetical protein
MSLSLQAGALVCQALAVHSSLRSFRTGVCLLRQSFSAAASALAAAGTDAQALTTTAAITPLPLPAAAVQSAHETLELWLALVTAALDALDADGL